MIDGTNETLRFKSILKLIGFDQLKIVREASKQLLLFGSAISGAVHGPSYNWASLTFTTFGSAENQTQGGRRGNANVTSMLCCPQNQLLHLIG